MKELESGRIDLRLWTGRGRTVRHGGTLGLAGAVMLAGMAGGCGGAARKGVVAGGTTGTGGMTTAAWLGTWGAAPDAAALDGGFGSTAYRGGDVFSEQTLRLLVPASAAGTMVRVRLSNEYGTAPLVVGAVHVAEAGSGAAIVAGTDTPVPFGGEAGVTMPAGGTAVSDGVEMEVTAGTELAVSVYVKTGTAATAHVVAAQASYVGTMGSGDQTGASTLTVDPDGGAIQSWPMVTGVDVLGTGGGTAVAFGDSLTDGYGSEAGQNGRWPDVLAARLRASGSGLGVVNEGMSGNRLLTDGVGESGVGRFARDVLGVAGVRAVVIELGVNDIGRSDATGAAEVTALTAGLSQLIEAAHAQGLVVVGATLSPFGGSEYDDGRGARESERQALNAWIRMSAAYDAVADFDAAVRDPAAPGRILPSFDSGDHLHMNDAGYAAMGGAVELGAVTK